MSGNFECGICFEKIEANSSSFYEIFKCPECGRTVCAKCWDGNAWMCRECVEDGVYASPDLYVTNHALEKRYATGSE